MGHKHHFPSPLYSYKRPLMPDECLRILKRKQRKRRIKASFVVTAGTTAMLASVGIVQALDEPSEDNEHADATKTTCHVRPSDSPSLISKAHSIRNFVTANISPPEHLNNTQLTSCKTDVLPQASTSIGHPSNTQQESQICSARLPEENQMVLLVEEELIKTREHLDYLQTVMGLDDDEVQSSIMLVQQLPQYQNWLTEWQDGEHQLLINQNTSVPISFKKDSVDPLLQAQQLLLDQMHRSVMGLAEGSLVTMNPTIRDMILGDLVRYDYLEDWLSTIHQLQILERSYQNHSDLSHYFDAKTSLR